MANDWNRNIIDEFHANAGKVGGPFAGATLCLLTTTGAKSGKSYTNPLVCHLDGDRIVIVASKGGAPTSPDWYHNLVKNPRVKVELGAESFEADASIATGEERDRLYAQQVKAFASFAEYEQKTTRKIPVVTLKRVA